MSAKNFRFRSPGIKIEEIDESVFTVPPLSEVGPVIVGRSQHGPVLKPVTVTSVGEFTDIFGVPSPGGIADPDLWRGENTTAPDYGAYAALAYLRNSAPVTFIRLAGFEHPTKTDDGKAGWQTTKTSATADLISNGGAYGLWLIPSASGPALGTGSLAASFYINSGSAILLSGSGGYQSKRLAEFSGKMDVADIKLRLSASTSPTGHGYTSDGTIGYYKDISTTFNPSAGNFIRKAFNTSPILANTSIVDKPEYYWLGETFEDYIKDLSDKQSHSTTLAFIAPLTKDGDPDKANYRFPAQPARTGYVFSQHDDVASAWSPLTQSPQQLFRIAGLTEGSWASKNLKISISNISYTAIDQDADPYGTFNVEVRSISDTDDAPVLLESFEGVNLNPRSFQYIARVIGTQYLKWNSTNNKVELFGDYPNRSRYIRVEMNDDLKEGNINSKLIPFGFMGPARRKKFQIVSGSRTVVPDSSNYIAYGSSYAYDDVSYAKATSPVHSIASRANAGAFQTAFTASLEWPDYLLRVTASNATRGLARNAYFGIRTSRTDSGRYYSDAYVDLTYPLEAKDDSWVAGTGTEATFAFSLDDVQQVSSSAKGYEDNATWAQGNRSTVVASAVTGVKATANFQLATSVVTASLDTKELILTDGNANDPLTLVFNATPATGRAISQVAGYDAKISVGISGSASDLSPGQVTGSFIADQINLAINSASAGLFTSITYRATAALLGHSTSGSVITQTDAGTAGNTAILTGAAGTPLIGNGFATAGVSSSFAGGVDASAATYNSITANGTYYKSIGGGQATQARYSNSEGWKTILDAGYNAFTMPMHGGFDGVDIKQRNPFSIERVAGGATDDGRSNYAWFSILTALKQLRDPEYLDFNLAAVPGLVDSTLNAKLADYCKERGDSLALLDIDSGYRPTEDLKATTITATSNRGTVSGAVDYRRNSLSSVIHSYAATFYPWVDITDGRSNSIVSVPPTVAMMGVFGRVKQTSEVWFAPAGFNRGGLSDGSTGLRVVNVKDRLTSSERDELYDAGINPIANFPAEGIVVFGQKTLQLQRSALDRINVRRLMIYLKRKIGGIATRILFEQNVKATWDNFTDQAVSVLDSVKDGLGLVDYKFILDESTTTPDLIDQNVLYAKLYIKPARAIEFIALDFIITKTGARFPE